MMAAPGTLFVDASVAVVAVLYLSAARRWNATRRRLAQTWPAWKTACFLGGLAVSIAAVGSRLDALAEARFSFHMVQHMLVTLVVAPLLLLGTPLLLALSVMSAPPRAVLARLLHSSVVSAATFPPLSWILFSAVLWATHYTQLYEAALSDGGIHAFEHGLYFGAALLFWFPVVGLEPSRWRIGFGTRLLYLFAFIPLSALLGVSLYSARSLLYPHYAGTAKTLGIAAIVDQQNAGAIMWIGGSMIMLVALLITAAAWAREDARLALLADSAGAQS